LDTYAHTVFDSHRRGVDRPGSGRARRPRCRAAGDAQGGQRFISRRRIGWIVCATSALVETLLARGNAGDMSEAEELSGRLAALGSAHQSAIVDITLLRVRTLLSRDRGDAGAFSDHLDRYREAAYALGFEGHIAWAEAMRT
jgi:hypothetical protein